MTLFWPGYDLVIRLLRIGIGISALWSTKSKAWIKGRKSGLANIQSFKTPPILFHVASLGEFEQARPVIESLKEKYPQVPIVLSFFSPSGYEVRKDYQDAEAVIYLPLDTRSKMTALLKQLKPRAIIFTKYDLWFNLIRLAQKASIPCFLMAANLKPGHIYFKAWTRPMSECLKQFTSIQVQDKTSLSFLTRIGFTNVIQGGDTRVDRVLQINEGSPDPITSSVSKFIKGRKVLILGSTWAEDDRITAPLLETLDPTNWCIIVAPHEVKPTRINGLRHTYKDSEVLSALKPGNHNKFLIVDTIGQLNKLYRLGHVAYIGGGFGKGIHNTLEPAAAGLPVLFGPKFNKFAEAVSLIDHGYAQSIKSSEEFGNAFEDFSNKVESEYYSNQIRSLIRSWSGASNKMVKAIEESGIIK